MSMSRDGSRCRSDSRRQLVRRRRARSSTLSRKKRMLSKRRRRFVPLLVQRLMLSMRRVRATGNPLEAVGTLHRCSKASI